MKAPKNRSLGLGCVCLIKNVERLALEPAQWREGEGGTRGSYRRGAVVLSRSHAGQREAFSRRACQDPRSHRRILVAAKCVTILDYDVNCAESRQRIAFFVCALCARRACNMQGVIQVNGLSSDLRK